MAFWTRLARATVYGLPLAFAGLSWWLAAGFPYYLDNNESFLSYLHARNLEIWNPNEYGWLTAHGTDPAQPATAFVYAHNPNGPRYLHYLLLQAGIRDLPHHVLILGLAGTSLAVWLLWRLFGRPALMVVALAVVLDYAGFLAWTVNTYRVWTFVLFFGAVLAVVGRRSLWLAVVAYLLFQVEYGMALFVGVTGGVLAILLHRRRAWPLIVALGVGAALSLTVFGVQVLAYYGWDGLLHELAATYARRGTMGEGSGAARYLYQAWHGPALLLNMVARDTHNVPVFLMVLWGLCASPLALRRQSLSDAHRLLAYLTVSVTVGTVAVSTVLYGYFVDSYVVSLLPLATLLVAPALGIVALELRTLIGRLGGRPVAQTLAPLVVLLPLVVASAMHFRPPVAVEYFRLLQAEYRGKTLVSPDIGAWQMGPALAFALTGGRAIATSDVDATPEDVRRFEALRDADGPLRYVCLDTLYIRKLAALGQHSTCELAARRMTARGHAVIAEGFGWTVIDVQREDRPLGQRPGAPAATGQATPEGQHGDQ